MLFDTSTNQQGLYPPLRVLATLVMMMMAMAVTAVMVAQPRWRY